jgi:CRP-like cAMP-binding protein
VSDEVTALAQAIAQSDVQDVARLMLMLAQEVKELSGYISDMAAEPDEEAWADYEPGMDRRAYMNERGISYDPELDDLTDTDNE